MDRSREAGRFLVVAAAEGIVGYIASTVIKEAVSDHLVRDIGVVLVWVLVFVVAALWVATRSQGNAPKAPGPPAERVPQPLEAAPTTPDVELDLAKSFIRGVGQTRVDVGGIASAVAYLDINFRVFSASLYTLDRLFGVEGHVTIDGLGIVSTRAEWWGRGADIQRGFECALDIRVWIAPEARDALRRGGDFKMRVEELRPIATPEGHVLDAVYLPIAPTDFDDAGPYLKISTEPWQPAE